MRDNYVEKKTWDEAMSGKPAKPDDKPKRKPKDEGAHHNGGGADPVNGN